jgi:hypothetical protein
MDKFAKDGIIINAQEYKKWRTHFSNPLSGIGRGVSEWIFSSYKEMMDQLRAMDELVRSIALGKGELRISVKDSVAEAKRALKENRLIDALYYSAIVNVIAQEILSESSDVVKALRTALYKQYGEKYNPQAMDYMEVLRGAQSAQQKAAELISANQEEIIIKAQFLQSLYTTFFGDPLEKSWKNEIAKFRGPVEKAVKQSDLFATNMMAIFDQMGIARTKGMIGDWVGGLDQIAKLQPQYGNDILNAFTALQPIIEAAKQNQQDAKFQQLGQVATGKMLSDLMLDMINRYQEPEAVPESVQIQPVQTQPVATQPMESVPDFSAQENPLVNQIKDWMKTNPNQISIIASALAKFLQSDQKDGFIKTEDNNSVARFANNKITILNFPIENLDKSDVNMVLQTIGQYVPVNLILEGRGSKAPVKERKGPGRPPKKAFEFMGSPAALHKFLVDQGKSEEDIKAAFQTVGLDYDKYLQGLEESSYEEITDSEIEYVDEPSTAMIVQKYSDAIDNSDQVAIINIVNALEDSAASGGEDQTITDDKGNIVAEIENGIISVEGIEIPVELVPKLLSAYKKKEIPSLPIKIGPSDKPIALPGKVEEPVKVEPKRRVVEPKAIKEVEPTAAPASPVKSDRIIIFTDLKNPDDKKSLDNLSKVLNKPVNVLTSSDRKVKEKYPDAEYYVYNIVPEEGEKELPTGTFELLKGKITKATREKLRELFGVLKRPSGKKKKDEDIDQEIDKKLAPEKAPDIDATAKVLSPGKAEYEGVVASVNADVIDNFTQKSAVAPLKDAKSVVILLQGKITGAEIMSSAAALESYFGKTTIISANREWAIKKIDELEKNGPVAVFMWDRESLRSVMKFTKAEPQATATASVEQAVLKLAHKRFYNNLQKAAEFNDPYLMANMMIQYSEAIEDGDPELSYELLAKAQEILDE